MVENIRYNVPLPLFCLLIILSGCNFREVLDDYPVSGVQITLDWTGVAENLPETVRVIAGDRAGNILSERCRGAESRRLFAGCRRGNESTARPLCNDSLQL